MTAPVPDPAARAEELGERVGVARVLAGPRASWPADFARECLRGAAASFSGPGSPVALLRATDDDSEHRIGPPGEEPAITLAGQSHALLAWLLGRTDGSGLSATPAGPLPPVPPW